MTYFDEATETLPREQLGYAFGIGYSQMCGPMQAHEEGSMMLAMQMGKPKLLTPEQSEKITPQILKQRSQDKAWDHYVSKTKLKGFL